MIPCCWVLPIYPLSNGPPQEHSVACYVSGNRLCKMEAQYKYREFLLEMWLSSEISVLHSTQIFLSLYYVFMKTSLSNSNPTFVQICWNQVFLLTTKFRWTSLYELRNSISTPSLISSILNVVPILIPKAIPLFSPQHIPNNILVLLFDSK